MILVANGMQNLNYWKSVINMVLYFELYYTYIN